MTLYKISKKVDDLISFFEENLIFLMLAGMLLVVFFGVVNRIFFQFPMAWSEEVARYLLIWVVFLGGSLGIKRSIHISVDALIIIVRPAFQKFISLFVCVVGFVFCAWIFYIGADFVSRLISTGQLSPALRMPIYIAYAAVPCGFGLMALRYFIRLILFFNKRELKDYKVNSTELAVGDNAK